MVGRLDRGFTALELAVVLMILIVGIGIGTAQFISLSRNTRALQAVADLYAVRAAAYLNYGDTAKWPSEAPEGIRPAELAQHLPRGFRFTSEYYRIDWENWTAARPDPGGPRARIVVGVSVISSDGRLLDAVEGLLSHREAVRTGPSKTTLQIAGPDGI